MAYPLSGLIKIYPTDGVILFGQFALNSDAAPQPTRVAADLNAYYDARVVNLAVAPCLTRNTEKPAASGVYVPLGGTYELQFDPSQHNIEFYDGAYPSPVVATKNGLNATFPVGMIISSPIIYAGHQTYFGPSRDREIDTILLKYFGTTCLTYTPGTGLFTGTIASASNAIISNPLEKWSLFQLMRNFGFSIDVQTVVSGLLNTPRSVNSECFILATYNTQHWSVTTPTPNVMPGQITEINDANSSLDAFDEDGFLIYWDTLEDEEDSTDFPGLTGGIPITRNLIITFSKTVFKFIMPDGLPYGGRRLMLVGTGLGLSFTGKFPIQNFNVQLVDGSGLYTLVEDKTNDTYYDRSVVPSTTIDLKIPDPFAKTGLVP